PFAAKSPSDYWNRWHMSLSSWIRDYVFEPLGGVRRRAPLRTVLAALVSMTLVGLWHGLSWHFVLWGVSMGLLLVVHGALKLVFSRSLRALPRALRVWGGRVATGSSILLLSPLFFSADLGGAIRLWRRLASGSWASFRSP